ncbi:hypothetical protein [Burkholderia cepacia]|uniref:hypothetical protein n=1 Tax=Burkholderia cepacia TaxID=292 RepID=UPI00158C0AC3|nr:hypothetical protein [Burkholderia cepacia]
MNKLSLEGCNNKYKKKPWLAELSLHYNNEIKYLMVKPIDIQMLSENINEYIWELEEDVVYAKYDESIYSTFFVMKNGKQIELSKIDAIDILKSRAKTSNESSEIYNNKGRIGISKIDYHRFKKIKIIGLERGVHYIAKSKTDGKCWYGRAYFAVKNIDEIIVSKSLKNKLDSKKMAKICSIVLHYRKERSE